MRAFATFAGSSLLALVAASMAYASLSKREVQARDKLLASLPASVRNDMIKRGLDNLELDLEPWMMRDEDSPYSVENLAKRGEGEPQEPGIKQCVDGKFAMTFDDGPYIWERDLTDKFVEADMHMTYFVNLNNFGCSWEKPRPENLHYARTKGMTIGTHTATHPHMLTLTYDQVDQQIDLNNDFLWRAVGILPNFMRMPYGETNQTLNDYIWKKHRLHVVQWTTDSGDAIGKSVDESVKRIKTAATNGENSITLSHETHNTTVYEVVPRVLKFLKKKGIKSVGMKHCLGMKRAYKAMREPEPRNDATWNCDNVPAPGDS